MKRPNQLGSSLFVGLRALDPLLQYGILSHQIGGGLLAKLGLSQLPIGLATNTGTIIDRLGLSPYRLILLAMATGSAAKQIYWLLCTAEEEFPPSAAIPVVIYNSVFNSINSLAFTCTLSSASLSNNETFPQTPLIVGTVLYVAGLVMETFGEIQRRNFKRDPKNKGKLCKEGLWSVVRHVNYTGYSMWRGGYSMAAGGWVWGTVVLGGLLADFNFRAIPVLDQYCSRRVSFLRSTML